MPESARRYRAPGGADQAGGYAPRQLRERGAQVRALVHHEDERSANLAATGAEIAVGDMLDLAAVTAAARGITPAYFTYPIAPGLLAATAIFAQAASDSGIGAAGNHAQIPAPPEPA